MDEQGEDSFIFEDIPNRSEELIPSIASYKKLVINQLPESSFFPVTMEMITICHVLKASLHSLIGEVSG